jgi:hypothetical protein
MPGKPGPRGTLAGSGFGITAEKRLHFLEGILVVCEQLSDR